MDFLHISNLLHFAFFARVIHENPWMLGAFTMMGAGGIVAWLRNIPFRIINAITSRFVVSIVVDDSSGGYHNDAFDLIKYFFAKHERFNKRAKHFMLEKINVSKDKNHNIWFSPSTGLHMIWFKRRPIWVGRTKKEREGTSAYTENWHFSTFSTNVNILKDLISHIADNYADDMTGDTRYFYALHGTDWRRVKPLVHRSLATLCLKEDALKIIPDIERFIERQDWYQELGIPYHRGYLLHGVPGTGKTSYIRALAHQFDYNLCYINLNSFAVNDTNIQEIFAGIPSKSFLILEDIDAVFGSNPLNALMALAPVEDKQEVPEPGSKEDSRKTMGHLSFSGLLNALDGLLARDGLIYFMTTNHKEKLDPALIRPGRIDYEVYFDYANEEQIKNLFLKFFPGETAIADSYAGILKGHKLSMAKIQGHLIENMNSAQTSLETAASLLVEDNSMETPKLEKHMIFNKQDLEDDDNKVMAKD